MRKSLNEEIIHCLSFGPKRISSLVAEVATNNKTTIQGVYKALRILKNTETVTIHKKIVSLSIIWVEGKIKELQKISDAYKANDYIKELQLGNKKSLKFKFSTFYELDLFWTHLFIVTEGAVPTTSPIYMIIPHDWFLYLRSSSDTAWVNKLAQTKRPSKMIITHAFNLDKKIAAHRKKKLGKLFEYCFNLNPLKQSEEEYYNIVGPWVFVAKIDKTVSRLISNFLKKSAGDFNEKDLQFLDSVIKMRGNFTLTVSYSERKASSLIHKTKNIFTTT